LAAVVKAYRNVLDGKMTPEEGYAELQKVSHREYTGIGGNEFIYGTSSYIRNSDVVAVVTGYDEENNLAICSQRNKFYFGDDVEVLTPNNYENINIKNCQIYEYKHNNIEKIDATPHATMEFYVKAEPIPIGSYLRVNKAGNIPS
jgi:putative protease